MTKPIQDGLVALLRDYQDIFAWSYQDMPSLNLDIVQHRLPLNPGFSPVKQKLRRMKPEMSLKIKEEVKKKFDVGFLGVGEEKKEVKVGTGMTTPIQDELVALLRDYQDIFAWSYQYMPGLNPDIVQHRLPLNPGCSSVKQKLRRMKPKMSLKIKEKVKNR